MITAIPNNHILHCLNKLLIKKNSYLFDLKSRTHVLPRGWMIREKYQGGRKAQKGNNIPHFREIIDWENLKEN